MSTLPALDLSDFAHPLSDREWVYGPRRTDWIGGHPIVAIGDPGAGEPMLEFRGPLGLHRDQLPHVAAFILAVYEATEPVDPAGVEADDRAVESVQARFTAGARGWV